VEEGLNNCFFQNEDHPLQVETFTAKSSIAISIPWVKTIPGGRAGALLPVSLPGGWAQRETGLQGFLKDTVGKPEYKGNYSQSRGTQI